MELAIENLKTISQAIQDITGIYAYFNDTSQTSETIKFDLRYKGLAWKKPLTTGILRFDCVLCGMGVTEQFIVNIANAEIKMSEFFNIVDSSDRVVHNLGNNQWLYLQWNDDEAMIEPETKESGINYYYKRYLKLEYQFKNS